VDRARPSPYFVEAVLYGLGSYRVRPACGFFGVEA
jgi:hypothetical protein